MRERVLLMLRVFPGFFGMGGLAWLTLIQNKGLRIYYVMAIFLIPFWHKHPDLRVIVWLLILSMGKILIIVND